MGVLDVAEPVEGLWLRSEVSDCHLLLAPEGAHPLRQGDGGVNGCKQKKLCLAS